MKITPANLRLIIFLVIIRLFLLVSFLYGLEELIYELDIPPIAYSLMDTLARCIDLALFIYLFFFLNKFLGFKKSNIFILLIIAIRIIFLLTDTYTLFADSSATDQVQEKPKLKIVDIIVGISSILIMLLYCFSLLRYFGGFRKQIVFYATCQMIALMIGIIYPLIFLKLAFEYNIPYYKSIPDMISALPYLGFLIIYYKASKIIVEPLEPGALNILDSDEHNW